MKHNRFFLLMVISFISAIFLIHCSVNLVIGMPQVIQIPQATVQAYRSSFPLKSKEQVIIDALGQLEKKYFLMQGNELKIITAEQTNAWHAYGYITNTGDGSDLQKSTVQKLKSTKVWFLILASDWRKIDPVRKTYSQDSYYCVAVIGEVESGSVSVFPGWKKEDKRWTDMCKTILLTPSSNIFSYPPPSTQTPSVDQAYPANP